MYQFSEDYFDLSLFLPALQKTEAKRLVLFGAGPWGEALFDELQSRGIAIPVVFADNDPTKQGLLLKGMPVIAPRELEPVNDMVVITTISAGDSVSAQLEGLDFHRDCTYFEVMHGLNSDYPFTVIEFFQRYIDAFADLDILHIGPGGHLGVELLLKAMGAKSIFSVEYNSFGLAYPDVTEARRFYLELSDAANKKWHLDLLSDGLIQKAGDRLFIDKEKIHLLFPCTATALPFRDQAFDLVLHHAVFEHVPDPHLAYREIFRVLRPNGKMIGLVDPQDHRTFSSFGHYHPFSFLTLERREWYKISSNINFHNQITTPEHRHYLLSHGFYIDRWEVLDEMELSDDIWDRFNPYFHHFDRKDLAVLRFAVSARRPH